MTVQSEEAVAAARQTGSPVFRRILLKLSGESLMGVVKATYLRGERVWEDGRVVGGVRGEWVRR